MKRRRTPRSSGPGYTDLLHPVARAAGRYVWNRAFRRPGPPRRNIRRRVIRRRRPLAGRRLDPHKGPLTKAKIRKKLRSICTFMKEQEAVHVHKRRDRTQCKANANETCYHEFITGGSITHHEAAVATLRYFDPGTNTLVTQSAAAGSYKRDIKMSIVRKLTVANNFQVPVRVDIWSCKPKNTTSTPVVTAMTNSLVDQNAPSATSPLIWPRDATSLSPIWTLNKLGGKVLKPGETMVKKSFQKNFKYKFDIADVQTSTYQKQFAGHVFLLRITGVYGHDTIVANQVTEMPCGVDAVAEATYSIKYNAGKDLHDITLDDNVDATFTNAGVVSNCPLADNQSYSVA